MGGLETSDSDRRRSLSLASLLSKAATANAVTPLSALFGEGNKNDIWKDRETVGAKAGFSME